LTFNYNLGKLHYQQNQLDESEAALKEAIKITADHFAAHFALGIIHMKKSRLKETEAEFKKSLEFTLSIRIACLPLGWSTPKRGGGKKRRRYGLRRFNLKDTFPSGSISSGTPFPFQSMHTGVKHFTTDYDRAGRGRKNFERLNIK
jgi:tetratricopeptide (TPR) repeat protein